MLYDARTNPRGFKLSIQQWPRHARVRQIAQRQGYRIPAPNFVEPTATPARALLNHGVWRAWCPDCPYAADDVWRGYDLFWCMRCGNASAGHSWRPLIWPENVTQIEADLTDFPSQAQNWEPWGAAVDHVAQAQEWVEHAGLMTDPEHGLTDNEVGGADDPETYTTPAIAVTNEIITSSDANADKGDIRYFRQFMPANPGGANYWLQSVDANSAAWVARATAVLAALGYTPVNKAGDTGISGDLRLANNVGLAGTTTGAAARDIAKLANDDSIYLGNSSTANVNLVAATLLQAIIGGNTYTIYHTGNLPAVGAYVPSGLIAAFATAAAIASGWARYTNLDGRLPVGAGTTFTVTYVESTAYGAAWSHTHTLGAHTHNSSAHTHTGPSHTHTGPSHTHTVTGTTGNADHGVLYDEDETGSGHSTRDVDHDHSFSATSAAGGTGATGAEGTGATGSTLPADTSTPTPDLSSATSWVIPSYAVVFAQKS